MGRRFLHRRDAEDAERREEEGEGRKNVGPCGEKERDSGSAALARPRWRSARCVGAPTVLTRSALPATFCAAVRGPRERGAPAVLLLRANAEALFLRVQEALPASSPARSLSALSASLR